MKGHKLVSKSRHAAYNQILRYDGKSGASLGAFASGGPLAFPRGMAFGPDGSLFVANYNGASVLHYSATGTFLNTFVSPGSGGLLTPDDLVFGPDGNLYVTGGALPNAGVLRYNGVTGAFMGQFAFAGGNNSTLDLAFGPDGDLYVTTSGTADGVLRFDGQTGALLGDFVASGSGGLGSPFGVAFSPVPEPSCLALLAVAVVLVPAQRWSRRTESAKI